MSANVSIEEVRELLQGREGSAADIQHITELDKEPILSAYVEINHDGDYIFIWRNPEKDKIERMDVLPDSEFNVQVSQEGVLKVKYNARIGIHTFDPKKIDERFGRYNSILEAVGR